MKIHKGDTVQIISGKDRGKSGQVSGVDYQKNTLMVAGLNVFKKNQKPKKKGEKGEVVNISRPIRLPKVMLVCPNCKEASRVGFKIEGEQKSRVCKKCKATI